VYEEVKTWPGFPVHLDSDSFRDLKSKNLLDLLDTPQNLISAQMMEFLHSIKEAQMILGLVTSSEKVITNKILLNGEVHHLFDFILTRDDCPFHKPHPWPYIKAIEISKVHSNECIIFEDSQVGLTAAHGSGANYFKVQWF
ncbi:MAG: HAD family hydrolase, partial [Bacteriovoracaceae bacterium]